jgi:thioredoxin
MHKPIKAGSLALLIIPILLLYSCSNGQTQSGSSSLEARAFSEKLKQTENAVVLDVRTPKEFEKGHLEGAVNINISSRDFAARMEKLDKSQPVFVYCLSGSRSQSAAQWMSSAGFKEVYEMKGGLLRWRSVGLPEVFNPGASLSGMSKEQFYKLVDSDKLVLVDFYADWCAPCKKMEPYLTEISLDMKDKVAVIRINIDENEQLTQELNIYALPTLHLYQNLRLAWSNVGYIEKDDVVKQLKH